MSRDPMTYNMRQHTTQVLELLPASSWNVFVSVYAQEAAISLFSKLPIIVRRSVWLKPDESALIVDLTYAH